MGFRGFLIRWLVALLLVSLTFNPSSYSLFHWLWPLNNEMVPLKALVCLIFVIFYVVYLRATFRSMGLLGIFLVMAFCAILIWLFADQGWLDYKNSTIMGWVMIVIIGTVMGIGISWSHWRKKISGQFDTDDISE
ncbi:DUF6524 family protein [Marinicella sp. W31]|uniref:DUF6524 family protein n=1 Tax=Marinicella sp. W31 TaxID=3023713 RepID=UPI00375666F0